MAENKNPIQAFLEVVKIAKAAGATRVDMEFNYPNIFDHIELQKPERTIDIEYKEDEPKQLPQ